MDYKQSPSLVDALDAAPGHLPFVTMWEGPNEHDTVTFEDFRQRARLKAGELRRQGVMIGDRVVIVMPQGIPAMTTFVGAIMLGAVPAFLACPNFKTEPSKYRSGLAGVSAHLKAMGVYNPDLGTEDIVVVAEVEDGTMVERTGEIEQEIRSQVVAGMGVAVRRIFLKPPKWIVKSTAGKAARSATREKPFHEHPELYDEI
jgi:acyl-coenzyme A synthetase/AMP-(fatty) acid ligase